MRDEALLAKLEETAERLSIKLGYEDLCKGAVYTHGGIFKLRGEQRILIHRGLNVRDRIEVLTDILSTVDTEGLHLPPDLRDRLSAGAKSRAEGRPREGQPDREDEASGV